MDAILPILLMAIFLLVIIISISIPIRIAKSRNLSKSHLDTVKMLTYLGLIFGITWIVALILACVYPEGTERTYSLYRPSSRRYSASQNEIGDLLKSKFPDDPVEATVGDPVKCENCSRMIGKLETPAVWKDHVVCMTCHKVLSAG